MAIKASQDKVTVKILFVDDYEPILTSYADLGPMLIKGSIAHIADTTTQAIMMLNLHKYDYVVLDSMGDDNWIDVVKAILETNPQAKIIGNSGDPDTEVMMTAAGIDCAGKDLIKLKKILKGE